MGGISWFELQTTTIANSKSHGLLDSSTLGFDGMTIYSPIVDSDTCRHNYTWNGWGMSLLISTAIR